MHLNMVSFEGLYFDSHIRSLFFTYSLHTSRVMWPLIIIINKIGLSDVIINRDWPKGVDVVVSHPPLVYSLKFSAKASILKHKLSNFSLGIPQAP